LRLREAVRRTFARRGTTLPEGHPEAFQPEFQEQKEVLDAADLEFGKVLQRLRGPLPATLGG